MSIHESSGSSFFKCMTIKILLILHIVLKWRNGFWTSMVQKNHWRIRQQAKIQLLGAAESHLKTLKLFRMEKSFSISFESAVRIHQSGGIEKLAGICTSYKTPTTKTVFKIHSSSNFFGIWAEVVFANCFLALKWETLE